MVKTLSDIQGEVSEQMGAVCGQAFQNVEITTMISDGMSKVQQALNTVNNLCDANCLKNLMLQHLDEQYKVAEYTYDNAPLNMYIAQQNYVVNANGEKAYNDLLSNRYSKNADNEIEKLKNENTLLNERFNDYYAILYNQQNSIGNNELLAKNLSQENKKLKEIIDNSGKDINTYHRKSFYESLQRDSLNIWIVIASIIYWVLLIIWICIVVIYLRNFGLKFAIIMTILVAYPFISTSIYMYLIKLIGDGIQVVFMNVKNYAKA